MKGSRIELIQLLIDKYNYTSYLEIGCRLRWTIDSIEIENKIGVDNSPLSKPEYLMESDEYFKYYGHIKFDIIFIDGLHHEDQVLRDFNNSLACLNDGGIILIHDCIPRNISHQTVPRSRRGWVGDVWKAVMRLYSRTDITIQIVALETGMAIIKRGESSIIKVPDIMDWEYFAAHRDIIFNPITFDAYKKIL